MNCGAVMLKGSCALLNKKCKLYKNETKSKMKSPTGVFQEYLRITNFELQLRWVRVGEK